MDFGSAFSFVFQDEDWIKKILLIAVVSLIPIIGQIVAIGFALEIMKRVINNDPTPLPDLDFGGFLGTGFKAFIVGLVYAIPMIILILPMQVVPFLAGVIDEEIVGFLTIGVSCICGGLSFIYGILIAFLMPAAYGKLLQEDSIGAALKIGEVFGLVKKAPMPFLIAILIAMVGGLVASLGSIACIIGVFVTSAYSYAIMGHAYGQAYREALKA